MQQKFVCPIVEGDLLAGIPEMGPVLMDVHEDQRRVVRQTAVDID